MYNDGRRCTSELLEVTRLYLSEIASSEHEIPVERPAAYQSTVLWLCYYWNVKFSCCDRVALSDLEDIDIYHHIGRWKAEM